MTALRDSVEEVIAPGCEESSHYSSGLRGRTGLAHLIDGTERSLVPLAAAVDELRAERDASSDRPTR
jgi:hypothetical protein